MNTIKNILAALLMIEALCAFIIMFNEHITEDVMCFMAFTVCVSSLLAFLLIKSKE
jgi:hypothetical protein